MLTPRWQSIFFPHQQANTAPICAGWVMSGSPVVADMFASIFDAVVLDCQHGAVPASSDSAMHILRSLSSSSQKAIPLARCPVGTNGGIATGAIGTLLDAGARGIIAPMINDAGDARELVSACRYPYELMVEDSSSGQAAGGTRSWGPHLDLIRGMEGQQPLPLILAMIETKQAMQHLDEIAATPGLDGLFVGPTDLALGLGYAPTAFAEGLLDDSLTKILAVCEKNELSAGIFVAPETLAPKYAASGQWDLVVPSADILHLRNTATQVYEKTKDL